MSGEKFETERSREELSEEEKQKIGKKTVEVAEEWGKGWRVKEAEERADRRNAEREKELFDVGDFDGKDAEFLKVEKKPEKTMAEVQDALADGGARIARDEKTRVTAEKTFQNATERIGKLERQIEWMSAGDEFQSNDEMSDWGAKKEKLEEELEKARKIQKNAETRLSNSNQRIAESVEEMDSLAEDRLVYQKMNATAMMKERGWKSLEEGRTKMAEMMDEMKKEMFGTEGGHDLDGYAFRAKSGVYGETSLEKVKEELAEASGDYASMRTKWAMFDSLIKERDARALSASEDEPTATKDEPVVAEDEPTAAEDEPVVAEDEPVVAEDEPVVAEDEPTAAEDEPAVEDEWITVKDEPVVAEDELSEPGYEKYGQIAQEDFGFDEPTAVVDYEKEAEEIRKEAAKRIAERLANQETSAWKKVRKGVVKKALPVLLTAGLLAGSVVGPAAAFAEEINDTHSSAKTEQVVNVDETAEYQAAAEEKIDQREAAWNGVRYDYSDYQSRASKADYDNGVYTKDQLIEKGWKTSYNAYGMSVENLFENKDGSIESILEACKNSPEVLASHVSYFPSVLEECGLSGKNAGEIDDILSNRMDGGAMQTRLLEAYEKVLRAEGTTYVFYYENGTEQSRYIYWMDDNGDNELSPDELHLAFSEMNRNNAKQLRVVTTTGESADFNMSCGWQPNQDEEIQGVERIVVKEAVNEPQEEPTTPENPVNPEEPTPSEPTPEEPTPSEPTPEEPTPSEPEPEIAPKNEQAEIDNANKAKEAGEAAADITPTSSEEVEKNQPRTEEPGIPDWEQPGQSGKVPESNGNYTEEQAEKAQKAQEEANQNEITTPMTDEEFASEIERILNGGRS